MNRILSPLRTLPTSSDPSAARWRRLAGPAATWIGTVAVAAAVGLTAAGHGKIGLGLAAAVLFLGIFAADPILLPVIALPGSILIQRIGGSSNFSAADLLAFLGGLVALLHVRWRDATYLRQFLYGVVWYQAVLILVVIVNPNRYDIIEWFHRFSYLAATVLCGWVVATHGRIRASIRLFLLGASLLALVAVEHSVTGHFHPAQWSEYQKNSIGAVMWVAIVVAQVNPSWTGIGRWEARINKYICLLGLLASQSRQAGIILVLALGIAFMLNPDLRRRSKLIVLGAVPVVLLLYYSFTVNARNNPRFNSVSIREGQFTLALHVWHLSPLFGEGMRFYNLPQFLYVTAPPNVVVDNLSETGIVGSLAFVFLIWVTVRTMTRLPYALGTLGLVILVGHYVDGLFDIFWIGAMYGAPFIICGFSLGLADQDLLRRRTETASGGGDAPVVGGGGASPRAPAGADRPSSRRVPSLTRFLPAG
jgi:polysaccharide biosynthesis protein PslJ